MRSAVARSGEARYVIAYDYCSLKWVGWALASSSGCKPPAKAVGVQIPPGPLPKTWAQAVSQHEMACLLATRPSTHELALRARTTAKGPIGLFNSSPEPIVCQGD